MQRLTLILVVLLFFSLTLSACTNETHPTAYQLEPTSSMTREWLNVVSACIEGEFGVFTPEDIRCHVEKHARQYGAEYLQYLDDDLALIVMPSDSLPMWIGGVIIYHLPSVSTLVFDRCGRYEPSFDRF